MSGFTFGRLPVAAMQAETKATLDEIRKQALTSKPDLATLAPGWGTIYDDESMLGYLNASASPLEPQIEQAADDDIAPEHLKLRLYYYAPDRTARQMLGQSASVQQTHRLRAFDVLFARRGDNSLLILVSTRDHKDQGQHVLPAVRSLLAAADPNALLQADSSPLDLGSADLFMWLIWRWSAKPELTPSAKLIDFRDITSRDVLHQGADLREGVHLHRRELLALVTNENIEFGPAKIVVEFAPANAALDFQLFIDGGFSVHTTASHYADRLGRDVLGPRALLDLAFGVVPAIKQAYRDDKAWKESKRAEFLKTCQDALAHGRPNPLTPATS